MPVSKKRKKKSNIRKTSLPAKNKLSEVIMEFVTPLSERLDNIEMIKKLVVFGIVVWNISLLPIEDRERSLALHEL